MKRVMITALVLLGLAACTPDQLASISHLTGSSISDTDSATLVALPDVPVRIGTQVVQVDGTVIELPEESFSPVDRFWLAVSRTEWANHPELHRKLSCVANRETGGTFNPRSFNGRRRDRSYGYMQINMKAHSLSQFGLTNEAQLFDPETNLRAAWVLYSAARWSPWAAQRNRC